MVVSTHNVLIHTANHIKHVLQEWHALEESDLLKRKLHKHVNILENILDKYDFINEHFYPDMVIEHRESEATFKCTEDKLLNIKNQMNTIIHHYHTFESFNCCLIWLAICLTQNTSHINELHSMSFAELSSVSKDMDETMGKMYGKARSFENEIARKCWILCGAQNVESVPKARFFQALAHLVNYHYRNDFLEHKNDVINAITMFIDRLDGCFGDPPDNEISRLEVMHLMNDVTNSLSLIELLCLDDVIKPKCNDTSTVRDKCDTTSESSITLSNILSNQSVQAVASELQKFSHGIQQFVNFNADKHDAPAAVEVKHCAPRPRLKTTEYKLNKPVTVLSNDPIHIPVLVNKKHYGEKWPSKLVCKTQMPFDTSKIRISFAATDQGWGGTGHCSVRYQLDDGGPQLMYFVQNGKYLNNLYVYDILKNIDRGTRLSIYLCCAPWPGWEAHISNVTINMTETH